MRDAPLFSGLEMLGRPVGTASPRAQRYFDQGLAFLYGFNHEEAIRSFEAAAAHDPSCAMAYWGIAMGNGPDINDMDSDTAHEKAAWTAVTKARSLATNASSVEQALINAVSTRYSNASPADRRPLDRAYADAMVAVWKANPDDADVGALAAEALLDLSPWDFWTSDGKPRSCTSKALQILDSVMAISPRHPFALHLLIHALEMSPHPGKAAQAADVLREISPNLEHLLHMPSHIDVLLGHWQEAIAVNEKAITADNEYWHIAGQERYGIFRYHNYHMMAYAALMQGEEQRALHAINDMLSTVPESAVAQKPRAFDGFWAMRYELLLRFGRWDAMLLEKQPRKSFPITTALWHYARGVAYAATHDTFKALVEYQRFQSARRAISASAAVRGTPAWTLLRIADKMLLGEIRYRQGKSEEAISELRDAITYEDALCYAEPPLWLLHTRHALGAILMDADRYIVAEAVYRGDLRHHPENGWALFGLYRSLWMQGKKAEAASVKARFDKAWTRADFKISSSCCCLPDKLEQMKPCNP
jgi:tetratricopeptide (TPR) repeat protein